MIVDVTSNTPRGTNLSTSIPICTSDISEFSDLNSVTIYPNPVANSMTIKTNNSQLSKIIVYDIAFSKIFEQDFTNSVIINISKLSKGIYIYEVSDKNRMINKGKFVKQ